MPRALLIGSGHGGLVVAPSVDRVDAWLRTRGFTDAHIDRRVGPDATRDGMLAGLAALAECEPGDDPVVVYYAGHGHLYRTGGGPDGQGHSAHPLLVAIDIEDSGGGVLRSVLGSELARGLQRVARRTHNLTVILDCCHASGMVRLDDDLDSAPAHAADASLHRVASEHIERKRVTRSGAPARPRERLSDRVVVLAASSAGGRAYADPATGRLIFTDALLAALADSDTWDTAFALARERVQRVWPMQQPALFGPRHRRPLGLDERLPPGELFPVETGAGRTILHAPPGDIDMADRFDLISLASTTYGPAAILGAARPLAIDADRCTLEITAGQPPGACHARRTVRGRRPAIALECDDPPLRARLAACITAANLRIAGPTAPELAGRISLADDHLHIHDHRGAAVHVTHRDHLDLDAIHRCLLRLDTWLGLSRWLGADTSGRPLHRCYALEWGRAGQPPAPGPLRLRPGDSLSLSLHNLDRGEPELYAQAIRVRADRQLDPWSPGTGAHSISARQRHAAGQTEAGVHLHPIDRPPALPAGEHAEWTLVVVANQAFAVDHLLTPPRARALLTGAPTDVKRGDEDHRRVDIVAFPYTLELA